MQSMLFLHSALVLQNCATAHVGAWQTVSAVNEVRSYVPQHTLPPVQSEAPRQWNVATSDPQETVLVARQNAASAPPSAGKQHVFDLRSQGLPQLSTT
jgi:hypothetical protein